MEIGCAALLIDVDGTLLDSSAAVERAWRVWAAEWRLDPELVLAACHGRRTTDTVAELLPASEVVGAVTRLDELELADIGELAAVPGAAGLPQPRVMVNGPDLENGKPHPEGYLAAAAALGVDPARCVVIEDAPAGIAAGKAAGVAAHSVPDGLVVRVS